MRRRASGILAHVTSLPSPHGIGDLGPGARNFVDFLARAGQSVWQVLPIGPTGMGNSPYSSFSAFAGNPLLISPEALIADGYLLESDLGSHLTFPEDRVDYERVVRFKNEMLKTCFERNKGGLAQNADFIAFCEAEGHWLDDYALFMSIKNAQGGAAWTDWPAPLRDREPEALREASMSLLAGISFEKFVQFLFMRQWDRLKDYANTRGVHIFGDAPIYVTLDSSDCWANPELFKLGPDKKPRVVAGVPPDYFSATGQLWGNPVYDWSVHAQTGFSWWISRIGQCARLYDLLRIDHFRGFSAYWEVDATEETAINGTWVPAPGYDLFEALFARFTCLNIVAEDLGYITPDVRELRDAFNFPGMKVLQFTFGPEVGKNNYALHNHVENALAYTGTHDNNTTRGWYDTEAPDDDKSRLSAYTGKEIESHNVAWEMIRLAMMSVSRLAVFPIQDALNLGAWARMNTPAEANGNWAWRMAPGALTQELAVRLREMAVMFGRA